MKIFRSLKDKNIEIKILQQYKRSILIRFINKDKNIDRQMFLLEKMYNDTNSIVYVINGIEYVEDKYTTNKEINSLLPKRIICNIKGD